MTCTEALELVEPVTAGDIELDPAARTHFETCVRCAAALAAARRIDASLGAMAAEPPPRFTAAVLARIRRERWRSEQNVDRVFNIAIAVALVLMAGGVVALLNLQAILGVVTSAWALLQLTSSDLVAQAVPSAPTYVSAAGLVVSALAMWWWAERKLSL